MRHRRSLCAPGPAPAPDVLFGLSECIRHRGPDDNTWWQHGRFSFAHRRLSIIDLSSGRQPMASADGHIVITYNGEIYNYRELRRELEQHGHAFRTSSDTEVVINGYRQWGRAVLLKLRGMFAFAIADRASEQLLLARIDLARSRCCIWTMTAGDVRIRADAAEQRSRRGARSIRSPSATT